MIILIDNDATEKTKKTRKGGGYLMGMLFFSSVLDAKRRCSSSPNRRRRPVPAAGSLSFPSQLTTRNYTEKGASQGNFQKVRKQADHDQERPSCLAGG
jgi:hypothetical protein